MSIIALAMNILLAILLMATLGLGWRLDRRLRAVRDGHQAFARAVAELDSAAGRAHAGLAELRAATDEATDLLGGRIARAREACERLDQAIHRAETVPAPKPAPAPVAERFAIPPRQPQGGLSALLARLDQSGLGEPMAVEPAQPRARARPAARMPMADDELFVDGGHA